MKGKTDEGVDEPVTLADARSNRCVRFALCGCVYIYFNLGGGENGTGWLVLMADWPRRPSHHLTHPPPTPTPIHPCQPKPLQHPSVFVNGLRSLFPGIDILSEETDPEPLDLGLSSVQSVELDEDPWLDLKDVLITVDPLDATKEFTENLLQYVTTMVRAFWG